MRALKSTGGPMKIKLVFGFAMKVVELVERLIRAVEKLAEGQRPSRFYIAGGAVTYHLASGLSVTTKGNKMATNTKYTVDSAHVPVRFTLEPITAVFDADTPPNEITDYTDRFRSADDSIIKVVFDEGSMTDGQIEFGKPGVTTVTREIVRTVRGNEEVLPVDIATFELFSGAIGTIEGGGITFEGIQPDAQ